MRFPPEAIVMPIPKPAVGVEYPETRAGIDFCGNFHNSKNRRTSLPSRDHPIGKASSGFGPSGCTKFGHGLVKALHFAAFKALKFAAFCLTLKIIGVKT